MSQDNIFDNEHLKMFITFDKNFLYNDISPIISTYKNKLITNENIRKIQSNLKKTKIITDEEGLKYQISKNTIRPTFSNLSSIDESDTSSVASEKNNYEVNIEKLNEFHTSKISEINNIMKRFYDLGLILTDNIKDVKFDLSNFCAFISINLSLCPSMIVNEKDEMMDEIISLCQ